RCHPTSSPVLFLLVTPPPSSTLFPYTTLFRSARLPRCGHHHRQRPRPRLRLGPRRQDSAGQRCGFAVARVSPGRGARAAAKPHRDRKSTRLNSSHVAISYAVFCLKKKKKKSAT